MNQSDTRTSIEIVHVLNQQNCQTFSDIVMKPGVKVVVKS